MVELNEEQLGRFGAYLFKVYKMAEIMSTCFNQHLSDIGKEWKRKEKADFAELKRIMKRGNDITTELLTTIYESKDAVTLDDTDNPTYAKIHDALWEEANSQLRIFFAASAALRNKNVKLEQIEEYLYSLNKDFPRDTDLIETLNLS